MQHGIYSDLQQWLYIFINTFVPAVNEYQRQQNRQNTKNTFQKCVMQTGVGVSTSFHTLPPLILL